MYDEYDEEVAAAEAAEEAAIAGRTLEDKDAEIKPFLPKCAPFNLSGDSNKTTYRKLSCI